MTLKRGAGSSLGYHLGNISRTGAGRLHLRIRSSRGNNYHKMQIALCMLLLAWGCWAAPRPEEARSYATAGGDINLNAASTHTLLSKVSSFLQRMSELTSKGETLSPEQAMTLLPDFVVEAVKLRDELDLNPVKDEDPAAIQKVKDLVEVSLRSFAHRFDNQSPPPQPPVTTQEPEPSVEPTVLPEDTKEAPTEEPLPETTTLGAPVNNQITEEQDAQEETSEKTTPLADTPRLRPIPQRATTHISNPFSNAQAFVFSNPVVNHVQGPDPYVKFLPSGGYLVHYNQGK